MATVGQPLTSPETGWKRIQENDPTIRIIGQYNRYSGSDSGGYIGWINQTPQAFCFNFTGTKVRLIDRVAASALPSINVILDGVVYGPYSQNGDVSYQRLLFEKLDLSSEEHSLEIMGNQPTGNNYALTFDAVDIDSAAEIRPYSPFINRTVDNTNKLAAGYAIRCTYNAPTANAVGTFSELGSSTLPLLPVDPVSTSNGSFLFIMVGYDNYGRKVLVADRNIQSGVSWTKLNLEGIAAASGKRISIDGKDLYTIRLLSGGTSGSNSEWLNIIQYADLKGSIARGQPGIWNYYWAQSWTLDSDFATSLNRIARGGGTDGLLTSVAATSTSVEAGFRPVLLVDSSPIEITPLEINPTHVYKNPTTIKANIDTSPDLIPVSETIIGFDEDDAPNLKGVDELVKLDGSLSLLPSMECASINATALAQGIVWEMPIYADKYKELEKVEVL